MSIHAVSAGSRLGSALAAPTPPFDGRPPRCKRLRQELHHQLVVVLVHDEAGQQVGLAEDDAVGVAVLHMFLAEGDCRVDSPAQQRQEFIAAMTVEVNRRMAIWEEPL